ncbi:MAG: EpsG family protein [Clostridia bacterium]|nr:EpsG family protein [Clostridia bacterium]
MKKKSNMLYAVAFVVIFILMAFNYNGPDIGTYIATYKLVGNAVDLSNALDSTYMEFGYTFLMFCGSKIGLDFFAFRIILTFACLALLHSTIRYYKVNPNFIVGLYMVYLFFFDTIQLRNCLTQFIILFATRYLFQKSGLSILKYIGCIIIAGSIHTLSFVYLVLLLTRFSNKKIFYQILFGIATIMFIGCVLLQPFLPQILTAISQLLNRGSGYFTTTVRMNCWVVLALHLVTLFPLYRYRSKISNESAKKTIDIIFKIEIIMGLFLPFSFINSNFNRIFRNVLILDTIGLALLYENSPRKSNSKQISLMALFLLIGGWLITDMYRNRNQDIIHAIMEYNLFFNYVDIVNTLQCVIVIAVCLIFMIVLRQAAHLRINKKRR